MHRRRYHPQQRRRAPCATARSPRGEIAPPPPPGPYIDLTDPTKPKLVGDLPAEFQEFARILVQRAADATQARHATAAEPCESLTATPPTPETAGQSEPAGEGEGTPPKTPVAAAVMARARARRSIAPPVAASVTSLPRSSRPASTARRKRIGSMDGLLLPQALEVVCAEGELLQRDELVLTKFVVIYLALELVSVDETLLAAAAGGAFVEVVEEQVSGLLPVELVGNVEEEHLAGLGRVVYD